MREVAAQLAAHRDGPELRVDIDMDALPRIADFVRNPSLAPATEYEVALGFAGRA
jgi:hypothetical protein